MTNEQLIIDILKKIDSRQDDQGETLARLTVNIEDHLRRTEILEKAVIPLKEHVDFVNKAVKALVIVVGLVATGHSIGIF